MGTDISQIGRNADRMDFSLKNLAARRVDALQLVHIFRELGKFHVDQTAVKAALLEGHSQKEIAKALGIRKSRVKRLARRPWLPEGTPRGRDENVMSRQIPLMLDFFVYVWGSQEAAEEAIAVCQRYDRERLPFHFADEYPADWLEQMRLNDASRVIPPTDTSNPPTPYGSY